MYNFILNLIWFIELNHTFYRNMINMVFIFKEKWFLNYVDLHKSINILIQSISINIWWLFFPNIKKAFNMGWMYFTFEEVYITLAVHTLNIHKYFLTKFLYFTRIIQILLSIIYLVYFNNMVSNFFKPYFYNYIVLICY